MCIFKMLFLNAILHVLRAIIEVFLILTGNENNEKNTLEEILKTLSV